MRAHALLIPFAPLLLLAVAGCSQQSGVPLGTVQIRLTDAPAAIEAVHIVVTEVSIHAAGGLASAPDATGWEVVNSDPTTYDLLTLRGGVTTTLAEALVPAGTYTQIRLKIGEGSNVVVDGVTYPLVVPSGAQTGLKLVHSFTVAPNGLVDLTLDFDAEKSVLETGEGTWHLQPTVTVTSTNGPGGPRGMAPVGAARPL